MKFSGKNLIQGKIERIRLRQSEIVPSTTRLWKTDYQGYTIEYIEKTTWKIRALRSRPRLLAVLKNDWYLS